jgi:hypothetical protein
MRSGRWREARRRTPLRVVEEEIAALHEELGYTLRYARAMAAEEAYRAAAAVIDEQRRSLRRAARRMERSFAPPLAVRLAGMARAAATGLAAAVMVGSAAAAALRPAAPDVPDRAVRAVHEASRALERASDIADPVALARLFGDAQQTVLEVAATPPRDPAVTRSLIDFVRTQRRVLGRNPHIPDPIRARAEEVVETVSRLVPLPPTLDVSVDAGPRGPGSAIQGDGREAPPATPAAPPTP